MVRGLFVLGTLLTGPVGAGVVRAEDWRGSGVFEHDLAFVDADTIVRSGDGRISFRAQMRFNGASGIGERGYDRVDLDVAARCPASASGDPAAVRIGQLYQRGGRRVAQPRGAAAKVRDDAKYMIVTICLGQIGSRGFANVEAAVAGGQGGRAQPPSERRFMSDEVELTGTVIQGFELNAINLCGSEEGCRDDAPEELCWLQSGINLPSPVGTQPGIGGGTVARAYTFRGRIERSATGSGFGHMWGYACQVTVTGQARATTISQRQPARPDFNGPGGRAAAVAAHAALETAIAQAGPIRLSDGGEHIWVITGLTASLGAYGRGNACYSYPKAEGSPLEPRPPSIGWTDTARVEGHGGTVTLATAGSDEALSFASASPVAARRVQSLIEKAVGHPVTAVEQRGRRVSVRFEASAPQTITFDNSGSATEAAGIAHQLRGREIAAVGGYGNRFWARPLRRVTLTFRDVANAVEAQRLMEALRIACAASVGS